MKRKRLDELMKYLSQVVKQAGARADVGPAAVFPAKVGVWVGVGIRAHPLLVEAGPCLALDQDHVEVLL